MRIAVLTLFTLLIGCGSPSKSEQASTAAPIGNSTDEKGRTSTILGSHNAAAVPKDLPAWVKVYPGSKIVSVLIDTSSKPGGSISYETPDPIAKIAAFNDAALAAADKKAGPKADTPDAVVRYVSNDGGSNGGMITISRDKALTSVTVLYKK